MLMDNGTKAIEALFENYKESVYEESELTPEQDKALDDLDKIVGSYKSKEEYRAYQEIFDRAIAYARSSEKAGFVFGFKLALSLMSMRAGTEKSLRI
jgi:hypothetical protein